ncbi:MAG TPA: D-alanyl-D-alanine carboxypeptidase/D-alanyl-D-alanine-endopeptidase, partial [Abditibacteriaceae bacterium]
MSLCFRSEAAPAPRALPPVTENKIRALLKAPDVQIGHVGVLISALGTAKSPQDFPSVPYDNKTQPVLFAQDADKRFLPASNMKLFTSAMALKVLGPDKTFATRVFAMSLPNGVEQLLLHGGGDMSLGAQNLEDLAQQVKKKGLKSFNRVDADSSLYRAEGFAHRFPDGWTLDDTTWYYGPIVSALAYERNHIDVTITGGQKPGDAATLSIPESAPQFVAGSNLTTGKAELAKRDGDDLLTVYNSAAPYYDTSRLVLISGALAPQQKVTFGIAVPSVDEWATSAFTAALKRNNLLQVKKAQQLSARPKPLQLGPPREIARHESPPVKELLKRLLKNSDNLYAEMMLRNAA